MRLATRHGAALSLLLACSPRGRPPLLGLFPDDGGASGAAPESGVAPESKPSGLLSQEACCGFWTIFDEQASADALNGLAAGDEMLASMTSSMMVLRADGQTSRGSDFPGGSWEVIDATAADGSGRRRMSIVLRSRLLRQEWRYEGLLFGLQRNAEPGGPADAFAAAFGGGSSAGEATANQVELRVIGKSTRWDVADALSPVQLGNESAFSMLKMSVDRSKLTPTIQPFGGQVDPAEAKRQTEVRRLSERSEVEELQRAIDDVRRTKAEHGDGWLEADRLVEGVHYWRVGGGADSAQGGDADEADEANEVNEVNDADGDARPGNGVDRA